MYSVMPWLTISILRTCSTISEGTRGLGSKKQENDSDANQNGIVCSLLKNKKKRFSL